MPKRYVLRCERNWVLESESDKEEDWLVVAALGDVLEKVLIDGSWFIVPALHRARLLQRWRNGTGLGLASEQINSDLRWDVYINTWRAHCTVRKHRQLQVLPHIKNFLTDYEQADINSIQSVFPETIVKECSFHFRQAVIRRVNQEGFQTSYNAGGDPTIRGWIREILALTLLPAFAIPYAWQRLRSPPPNTDLTTNLKLLVFTTYSTHKLSNLYTVQFLTSITSAFSAAEHRSRDQPQVARL